jgi:hypothetical protein
MNKLPLHTLLSLLSGLTLALPVTLLATDAPGLVINDKEYLDMPGLNVMLAQDYYPEGHQGGVSIIQNGKRVASNGDIRISAIPGQWAPTPAAETRVVDRDKQVISVRMHYPDEKKNRTGFNPVDFPDLELSYTVKIMPEGDAFRIAVDLDKPIPEDWNGRVSFSMELFPGLLFGKSFQIGDGVGVFPRNPNGPAAESDQGSFMKPLGKGKSLTVAAESDSQRMTIASAHGGELTLIDGRERLNDGWFIVRELVPAGATTNAIEWIVKPNALPNWKAEPVIQFSQIGYHPEGKKVAVIELDKRDADIAPVALYKVDPAKGPVKVMEAPATAWGDFLRSHYLHFDFSSVKDEGMYLLEYKGVRTAAFAISPTVYERGVWQPSIEYFLPVQMCHMRVVENFRVWHGLCHEDDAIMAPINHGHFDGFAQGPSTYCDFKSGEHVPGLNVGGWHDAGDLDLRIESQAETAYFLAVAYERFHPDFDNTTIDQTRKLVRMHIPDGKPDILQQIEHGLLSIVSGYKSMGRLYRGIQDASLNQYVHLGDAATSSDNKPFVDDDKHSAFNALDEASSSGRQFDAAALGLPEYGEDGSADDRWVFTEDNPLRELEISAELAASARVMRGYNDALAKDALDIAIDIWNKAKAAPGDVMRLPAAIELARSTGDKSYAAAIPQMADAVAAQPQWFAWMGAYSLEVVDDPAYRERIHAILAEYRKKVDAMEQETPYGIPYVPRIWGAGWGIQHMGVEQYFLHEYAPDLFPQDNVYKALEFVLGCHPGSNNASFVSGVGPNSVLTGYGINRADWSYIPGGTASGTALIRPDFPELNNWPFFWQQNEYCLGAPISEYVFLVLAADDLLKNGANK